MLACCCSAASMINSLASVKLYSPDVRTFLLMDKIQNLSDASEDEDDKVSNWLGGDLINDLDD